jgi:hypothetical protein
MISHVLNCLGGSAAYLSPPGTLPWWFKRLAEIIDMAEKFH